MRCARAVPSDRGEAQEAGGRARRAGEIRGVHPKAEGLAAALAIPSQSAHMLAALRDFRGGNRMCTHARIYG